MKYASPPELSERLEHQLAKPVGASRIFGNSPSVHKSRYERLLCDAS